MEHMADHRGRFPLVQIRRTDVPAEVNFIYLVHFVRAQSGGDIYQPGRRAHAYERCNTGVLRIFMQCQSVRGGVVVVVDIEKIALRLNSRPQYLCAVAVVGSNKAAYQVRVLHRSHHGLVIIRV